MEFNPLDYVPDIVGQNLATGLDTSQIIDNNVDDLVADFDPTDPNAEYGPVTGFVVDGILNTVTGGAVGPIFSQGAELLGQFHELTDNNFTINNIENTIDNVVEDIGDTLNDAGEAISDFFGF